MNTNDLPTVRKCVVSMWDEAAHEDAIRFAVRIGDRCNIILFEGFTYEVSSDGLIELTPEAARQVPGGAEWIGEDDRIKIAVAGARRHATLFMLEAAEEGLADAREQIADLTAQLAAAE